ncbi:MAG: sensor histidine kinase [Cellulosilyticaceae bacterium]
MDIRLKKISKVIGISAVAAANTSLIYNAFAYIIEMESMSLIIMSVLINGLLIVCLWRYGKSVGKFMKSVVMLKEGELSSKTDDKDFKMGFQQTACQMNQISEGLAIATEKLLKSDYLKTEFITNISHDLKTPLTAIINYTGLLKQEQQKRGEIQKGVLHLEERANGLKEKIERIVAAAKSITGNVPIQLQMIDLEELLNQMIGEYGEQLQHANLQLMVSQREPVHVVGDCMSLCQVIESIFDNIIQYAMPYSRVYVYLRKEEGYGVLEVKNMSREALGIDSDTLKAHIIEGTKYTDALGLGLTVSESLMQLQQGRLQVEIEGDLFKVRLYLLEKVGGEEN